MSGDVRFMCRVAAKWSFVVLAPEVLHIEHLQKNASPSHDCHGASTHVPSSSITASGQVLGDSAHVAHAARPAMSDMSENWAG